MPDLRYSTPQKSQAQALSTVPCSVPEMVIRTAMLNAALDHYDPQDEAPYAEDDTLAIWLMQETAEEIATRTTACLRKMGYSISQNNEVSRGVRHERNCDH